MKTVNVAAAVIISGGRIFATQRGYGDYKDGWEFPGGKIEPGESPEQALIRELKEELEADVIIRDHLITVECDYPDFHLSMKCFLAELAEGSHIKLLEHEASRWLLPEELDSVDWLPADVEVAEAVRNYLNVSCTEHEHTTQSPGQNS